VRRIQCIGNINGQFNQPIDGKRALLDQVLQGFAIHELHGDEGATALFGDLINRADVGMVQRRGRTCLASETLQRCTVMREGVRQKLECHKPAEERVLCLVHHAHAAAADFLQTAIMGDVCFAHR